MNRKEVLKEVTKLTETHCKKCQVTKLIETKVMNQKFCLKMCIIGQKFRELGEILTPETTAKKKEEIPFELKYVRKKYLHITKEIVQEQMESGKSYNEIEKTLGLPRGCLRYQLARHGLEGRRGTHYQSIASAGVHQTGSS